jgi:hypothetical protein
MWKFISKFIPSIASFFFWVGLQMTGIIIPWLGYFLIGLAVLLLLIPAWPYIKQGKFKKGANKMLIVLGALIILGGVFGGGFLIKSQLDFNGENSTIITNTPIISNTPVSTTFKIPTFMDLSKVDKSQKFVFSLGEGGISTGETLEILENGKKTAINLGGVTFDMYVTNGKFYVDTSLYGGEGYFPVQIKGNEFLIKPENWDKNYDETALEVINQDRDIVFQLIYESQYHIVMNGIFPFPGGVVIADKLGFRMGAYNVPHLNPIFKYPSSQYLGQRR